MWGGRKEQKICRDGGPTGVTVGQRGSAVGIGVFGYVRGWRRIAWGFGILVAHPCVPGAAYGQNSSEIRGFGGSPWLLGLLLLNWGATLSIIFRFHLEALLLRTGPKREGTHLQDAVIFLGCSQVRFRKAGWKQSVFPPDLADSSPTSALRRPNMMQGDVRNTTGRLLDGK